MKASELHCLSMKDVVEVRELGSRKVLLSASGKDISMDLESNLRKSHEGHSASKKNVSVSASKATSSILKRKDTSPVKTKSIETPVFMPKADKIGAASAQARQNQKPSTNISRSYY